MEQTKNEQPRARVETFRMEGRGGVTERHVMVHATDVRASFAGQLDAVLAAFSDFCTTEAKGAVSVFWRFFVSDAANQADLVWSRTVETADCAVSVVEQPPLDGTKVALWAYLMTGVQTRVLPGGVYEVSHGTYRHWWSAGNSQQAESAEYQTRLLLSEWILRLTEQGCRLADHCLRTWFFVRDVDVNYVGMVKARNEVFVTQGLTPQTHFIASTGIGGRGADAKVSVLMDAYAVGGIRPEQVHYLYAPTHLNPTYEYGVSFERGTYVDYGDRRHVLVSGTASIDNRGAIVAPGDIRQQTFRMWKNVEALLAEAGCTFREVGQMIVYLRDVADYTVVKELFDERFPDVPRVLVWAPVCRPGWLVEMECMAVKPLEANGFPDF